MRPNYLVSDRERKAAPGALTWLKTQPTKSRPFLADLPGHPPLVISDVSAGFYGVARHYGGMRIEGEEYIYVAEDDACIRLDVVRRFVTLHSGDDYAPSPADATGAAAT